MASLVLGAVGAGIGSFFGMPQLGWLIGSGIGSWLSAPDTYGPRLGEVKVQGSSYGQPLPIPYGVPPRFSGQVIWADKFHDIEHSQSAGKGGPQVITYTTVGSYAISICEGNRDGSPVTVVRAWKNGKLVYNIGSAANAQTLSKLPANLKFYSGTATQMPDPTIEAVKGVGNVSAYRGTVYAVLTDDDVTDNGGRPWLWQFEVASAGSFTGALAWESYVNIEAYHEARSGYWQGNLMPACCVDADGLHVFRTGVETLDTGYADLPRFIEHWVVPLAGSPYRIKKRGAGVPWCDPSDGSFTPGAGSSPVQAFSQTHGDEPGVAVYLVNPADSKRYAAWFDGDLSISYIVAPANQSNRLYSAGRLHSRTLVVFMLAGSPSNTLTLYLDTTPLALPTGDEKTVVLARVFISENYFWVVAGTYISAGVTTYKMHRFLADGTYLDTTVMPSGTDISSFAGVYDDDRVILEKPSTHDLYLWSVFGASYGASAWLTGAGTNHGAVSSLEDGLSGGAGYNGGVWPLGEHAAISWTAYWGVQYGVAHRFTATFAPSDVTLGSVQTDICQRCGLTAGEINVAGLTDVVNGYSIAGRMAGRAASEPLMAAYFYDAGEWDGKLNFVKRGAASAGVIPLADLGAYSYGSQAPDPVTQTRNDRTVLPTQVDVSYYDPANDNQAGLQSERRFTVNNDNPITLSFSTLSLTDDHAKGIAQVNLFNAWASASPTQFSSGPKWQHLTPTDVRDIEGYGTVRITTKHEVANGVIAFEAVSEHPSVYTQTAIGAGGSQSGQTRIEYPGPTRLELMDIPILRDADDDYGYYVAVDGFLSSWQSGTVFKSLDGGTTYEALLTDSDGAVLGYSTTALNDWDGSNKFDFQSSVTVELDAGDTLSSVTFTQLLQNGNAALLGSEVIQFQTATLVSTGIYTLTGLLRGRKGTEWACTGHAVGERFVLLDAATLKRVAASSTEIALALDYKAVSAGNSVATAANQTFTNSGVGKKPYAPVLLGAAKLSDGSWQLRWTRRGRIDNQWHAYASMPLAEASEAYEADFYDSTGVTFKRTYSGLSTPTVHYLLADVTTDGTAAHFLARVYQMGALGRGYAGTLTV